MITTNYFVMTIENDCRIGKTVLKVVFSECQIGEQLLSIHLQCLRSSVDFEVNEAIRV